MERGFIHCVEEQDEDEKVSTYERKRERKKESNKERKIDKKMGRKIERIIVTRKKYICIQ